MLTYLLLLTSLTLRHADVEKEKCKADFLKGVWYGDFNNYTGTTFRMYMDVQEVDQCKVTGVLRWPDYFNSATTFEGEIRDGKLKFKEVSITQGMIMDISRSFYTMPIDPSDTLKGTAYVDNEDMATFRIYRKESLDTERRAYYEQVFQKMDSVYGKTHIGDVAAITLDELRQQNNEYAPDVFFAENVKVEGRAEFNQVDFPLTMYFQPPGLFYMEMRIQNLKFIGAKNDSVSWSYDPSKDEVKVDDLSEEDGFEQFSNNFHEDTGGDITDVQINHATVEGAPAYRVAFAKDEELMAYYISKDGYFILRDENTFQVNQFSDFLKVSGSWIPQKFLQMSPAGVVNAFYFDEVQEGANIPERIFEIPEELKAKLRLEKSGPTVADLANEAFEEKDYERADELYSKAIDSYPYDATLYYFRGIARYEMGENYRAISDFERAIDLDGKVGKYYNYLGLVKYRFGDYQNAKVDFQKAVELDTSLQIAYLNTAFACYQLEEYDTAVMFLDRGITVDSTNGQFFLNRGIIRSETESYKEAVLDYEKAIQLGYGDKSEIENRIGVAYYWQKEFDLAAEYFHKAVKANPDDYQMQKNLANAYYYGGQYKTSTVEYQKAFKMKADDDDLLNSLAMSYYHQEDYDAAVHYLNKTIELNDQDANYFDNRAYSYAGMMRYQEAIDDFTTSIELYSKDMEVYYQRGLLLKIQNNRFDACRDFQKAMEMGHEQAAEEMKELCAIGVAPGKEEGKK